MDLPGGETEQAPRAPADPGVPADLRRHSHDTARGRRTSTEWHRTIYRALEAHDPAAAEKAMRDHLASVRELIASRVESH